VTTAIIAAAAPSEPTTFVGASIHPTNPFVSPTAHLRNAFSGIADNYFAIHIHGFATKITKNFLRKNITGPTLLIYPL
jgi:urate oxidase